MDEGWGVQMQEFWENRRERGGERVIMYNHLHMFASMSV